MELHLNFKKLIFISILFIKCDLPTTVWEDVDSNYEPILNILAIISLDPDVESFVSVYRTLDLSEPSEVFESEEINTYTGEDGQVYSWSDSLFERTGLIKNASVKISNGDESYIFNYSDKDKIFKDTLGLFMPAPNTIYNLTVISNEYGIVSGEVLTPEIPNLIGPVTIADSLSDAGFTAYTEIDTVVLSSSYAVSWDIQPTHGILTAAPALNYDSLFLYLSETYGGLELPDSVNETEVLCDINFPCCNKVWKLTLNETVDLSLGGAYIDRIRCNRKTGTTNMLYKLISMDQNLYDYFINQGNSDFSNFLLDSQGDYGLSIGIDGGLGVIGSIASDTTYINARVEEID